MYSYNQVNLLDKRTSDEDRRKSQATRHGLDTDPHRIFIQKNLNTEESLHQLPINNKESRNIKQTQSQLDRLEAISRTPERHRPSDNSQHRVRTPENNVQALNFEIPLNYNGNRGLQQKPDLSHILKNATVLDPKDIEEQEKFKNQIDEFIGQRKTIDELKSAGTYTQLKQVLRNLSDSKRKGAALERMLAEGNDDDDFDDFDVENLRSGIIDAYARGQKKTAQKVLGYAEKNELAKNNSKKPKIKTHSVGIQVVR